MLTFALALTALLPGQTPYARNAPWVGETLDGRACEQFEAQGVGPWDYTSPKDRTDNLKLVEGAHFTSNVRSLIRGATAVSPLHDLEYTIRAFPNHYPALYTMIRYATERAFARQAAKAWVRPGRRGRIPTPPECYLTRAIAFSPDDHHLHVLEGLFYHRKGLHPRAHAAYNRAIAIAPDSAEANYNFALLLADMGRYEEARRHGQHAYELGYPLDGLRHRLQAAGQSLAGD